MPWRIPWWPWRRRHRSGISFRDLPVEIVLEIVKYLPDVDHLCLALTCKSLLRHLDEAAPLRQLPKFRSCNPLPKSLYVGRDILSKLRSDRWKLLQRLETRDWRCCFGCFKLHPAHEFSATALKTPASERTCMYGPLVGVVRLCPCMNMTFRDKRKLTRILSLPDGRVKSYRIQDGVVKIYGSAGRHKCLHLHGHKEGGVSSLQCEISITLEEDKNLVVNTNYRVTDTERLPDSDLYRTTLPCPHGSLGRHILDLEYHHTTNWRPRHGDGAYQVIDGDQWSITKEPISCKWCQTTILDARWMDPPVNICFLTAEKSLGNAIDEADEVWYQHTDTAFEALPHRKRVDERIVSVPWMEAGRR